MNFKKQKNEVINDAVQAARGEFSNKINQLKYSQLNNVQWTLEEAVTSAIEAAIESLVNNVYTDDEFEGDLKLKP